MSVYAVTVTDDDDAEGVAADLPARWQAAKDKEGEYAAICEELGQEAGSAVTLAAVEDDPLSDAIAALEEGEPFVAQQIARATEGRRIVAEGLKATNRVELQAPDGAFYQFFSVDGWTDSRKLAIELVDTANVGLAPGTAFGPGGETGLRLCFARKASDLTEAVARLQKALSA